MKKSRKKLTAKQTLAGVLKYTMGKSIIGKTIAKGVLKGIDEEGAELYIKQMANSAGLLNSSKDGHNCGNPDCIEYQLEGIMGMADTLASVIKKHYELHNEIPSVVEIPLASAKFDIVSDNADDPNNPSYVVSVKVERLTVESKEHKNELMIDNKWHHVNGDYKDVLDEAGIGYTEEQVGELITDEHTMKAYPSPIAPSAKEAEYLANKTLEPVFSVTDEPVEDNQAPNPHFEQAVKYGVAKDVLKDTNLPKENADVNTESEEVGSQATESQATESQVIESPDPNITLSAYPTNYGTKMDSDTFLQQVSDGSLTEDDGTGYWGTDKGISGIDCFSPKPEWATHVGWFNK